ncbi:hypothetical protein BF95_07100 [Sphingobium sp. Ant17]|nr:hypothetical protein BF95_07100 [Sphingobium sp. Ant17]
MGDGQLRSHPCRKSDRARWPPSSLAALSPPPSPSPPRQIAPRFAKRRSRMTSPGTSPKG